MVKQFFTSQNQLLLDGLRQSLPLCCFTFLPESQIKKTISIYSNKYFRNFHLSKSSFTCPRLWASEDGWGLVVFGTDCLLMKWIRQSQNMVDIICCTCTVLEKCSNHQFFLKTLFYRFLPHIGKRMLWDFVITCNFIFYLWPLCNLNQNLQWW